MLSEGLWRQTFQSDPTIVGKSVRVGGAPRTVVGVIPASFHFPENMGPDIGKAIWLPMQPTGEMLKDRGYSFVNIVGKMKPGVNTPQVQRELDAIAKNVPGSAHKETKEEGVPAFRATPYQEVLTGPVRPILYSLFAALGLVLLIACANVSNLLIARCLGRQKEFAVRSALGASRFRLVRQMLAEGLLLSLGGCAIGILLAELAMTAVRKLPEGTIPRADAIAIHWTVIVVLATIAMATTLLSSLLPALLVVGANPQGALQASSRGVSSRGASRKLSGWLVAAEVALSTLLLVATGLLFHTLWNLQQSRLGFDAAHVTKFSAMPADAAGFSGMAVSSDTSKAPPSVATLVYQPLLERMRHVPGVQSAALITTPPLSGMDVGTSFDVVGRAKTEDKPDARISAVSGDYAQTMGIPLLRGRMINDTDAANTPFVLVINDALAKKYFPGENPLDKQLDLGGEKTGMLKPYTIVGVVADQIDSAVGGEARPFLLVPQQQIPTTSLFYQALLETVVSFVVKTRGEVPVAAEMRAVFHDGAPGFALDDFQTMQSAVEKNTFSQRLGLILVGSFAGLAILMVVAGLYGVLSQLVSYRRREIGVRMALGETRQSVAGLVVRQGSTLIASGLVAGLVIAFFTARLIKGFLYQVEVLDIGTYVAVAVALMAIGAVASLLPAWKAASIEPMDALRTE